MNEELRGRSEELNQVNAFLESVFLSVRAGVVVLDRELNVLVWNARAEDLWGLRYDEVEGTNFLALDIGLPVDGIRAELRDALDDGGEGAAVTVDAIDRRGRAFACQVTIVPLRRGDDAAPAAVVLTKRGAAGAGG